MIIAVLISGFIGIALGYGFRGLLRREIAEVVKVVKAEATQVEKV